MIDAASVIVGVLTDPAFGIPIILLVAGTIAWALWSRHAAPPSLVPYRYRRAWMDTAESGVVTTLDQGKFRPAMTYLYGQLLTVMGARYHLSAEQLDPTFALSWRRGQSVPSEARAIFVQFRFVYRKLAAAEGPSSGGFWTALLRASRNRKLRAAVEQFLPIYEHVMRTLEASP